MKIEYSNIPINRKAEEKSFHSGLVGIMGAFVCIMVVCKLIFDPTFDENSITAFKSEPSESVEAKEDESAEPLGAVLNMPDHYLPIVGSITSVFAGRTNPFNDNDYEFHRGIDIAPVDDLSVYAYRDGVVEMAGWDDSYGNFVKLGHGDGLETLYAHLDSIGVAEGDYVVGGQVIGVAGQTGNATGVHLHFETRLNKEIVNPYDYLY